MSLALAAVWAVALLAGCSGGIEDPVPTVESESPQGLPEATQEAVDEELTALKMNVQIGNYTFTATLEDNQAVDELVEMMEVGPVTLRLDDYSGFEKVGPLGKTLTASDSHTTTVAGDIVLYNSNNIVMFYGSNSWSYTRLGKIDDLTEWADALGRGSITAVLTLAE